MNATVPRPCAKESDGLRNSRQAIRTFPACTAALLLVLGVPHATAQLAPPSSSLRQGPVIDARNPLSQRAPQAGLPAFAPRPSSVASVPAQADRALQQSDLPANLAKLNDNTIIIVGDRRVRAGDVKRGLQNVDDNAIIIVGGRKMPARELKRELGVAIPQVPTSAAAAGAKGAEAVPSGNRSRSGSLAQRAERLPAGASGTRVSPAAAADKFFNEAALARQQARIAQLNQQNASVAALTLQLATARAPTGPVGPTSTRTITLGEPVVERKFIPDTARETSNLSKFSHTIYDITNMVTGKAVLSVTPGGHYAIGGRGFGAQQGRIYLRVNVNQRLQFNARYWQDNLIIADLDPAISGVADTHGELSIEPVSNKSLTYAGVRFEAAREVVALTTFPRVYTTVGKALGEREEPNYFSPANPIRVMPYFDVPKSTVHVHRLNRDADGFFEAGFETFKFGWLAPGFESYRFDFYHPPLVTRADDCNTRDGSMSAKGAYTAAWVGETISVHYGVQRCHFSPQANAPASDYNTSDYALVVYVIGPRGVNPASQGATHR